jgi:hypothetical protein
MTLVPACEGTISKVKQKTIQPRRDRSVIHMC